MISGSSKPQNKYDKPEKFSRSIKFIWGRPSFASRSIFVSILMIGFSSNPIFVVIQRQQADKYLCESIKYEQSTRCVAHDYILTISFSSFIIFLRESWLV